jgi:hypothetical protein
MWHERPNTTRQHAAAAGVQRRPNHRPLLWAHHKDAGVADKARTLSKRGYQYLVPLIVSATRVSSSHSESERALSLKVPRYSRLPDDAADLPAPPLIHDGPPWDQGELMSVLDEGVFA